RHTRFSRDWSSDVCSSDLRQLQVQVASLRAEQGMRCERDFQEQIAGLAAGGSFALSGQADVLAGLDAAGNLHIERAFTQPRPTILAHLGQSQAQCPYAALE